MSPVRAAERLPFLPRPPERHLPPDEPGTVDWSAFGPLAPWVAAEGVTDVFVNGSRGAWLDRGAGLEPIDTWSAEEHHVRELAVRLIALGGRHIDEVTPAVDVRVQGGIRIHAVLPPVSTCGTLLSIRIPRRAGWRLSSLLAAGTMTDGQAAFVRESIRRRENILITGAGGSGKTTLLSAMLSSAAASERIIAIEDVAELVVEHPHFLSLESRQANIEGAGRVGLEQLVREALRMRPDRLVVGECRGAEVRELLAALNTGHDGGAGTLHANSLADVPARLESLGATAGMTESAVARQTVSAIGVVLHLGRRGAERKLLSIGRFALDSRARLAVHPVSDG